MFQVFVYCEDLCCAVGTARPALKPMMIRYEMTREGLPDVVLLSPAYFPLVTSDKLEDFEKHATDVLAYVSSVVESDAPLIPADSHRVNHLLSATQDAKEWVAGGLQRCDESCSSRRESPQEISVFIPGESILYKWWSLRTYNTTRVGKLR